MAVKISTILVFLFLVILGLVVYRSYRNHDRRPFIKIDLVILNSDIPKIIHQTAPRDKTKWDPKWIKCQKSWKSKFSDFKYMMWTDEDLRNLIVTKFPWFLETYDGYDKNIKRIDIARYFILWEYGGIYADMDYECMKNFYHNLPKGRVSVSESPYKQNEHVQNALMASPPRHPFWGSLVETGIKVKHKGTWDATGPRLLDNVMQTYDFDINVLPFKNYNPDVTGKTFDSCPGCYTRHHGTYSWKKENFTQSGMGEIFTIRH
jgi:mannosyltransferase OCH1-like enzyme